MKKPSPALIKLAGMTPFKSLSVDYRQTGTDKSETYVTLTDSNGRTITGKWSTYAPYLEVRVDWAAVARVPKKFYDEAKAWQKFEKDNARDLTTYKRLKKKFEGGE